MFNLVDDTRNVDVAIFGLDIGKINKEFTVCDLKIIPKFDIAGYLKGYDETTVGFIADNAVYGQFRPKSKSKLLSLSPMVDDMCLLPFRLFKAGWISAMEISPIIKTNDMEMRSELDITRHLFTQIWADSNYKINKKELELIQEKYNQLLTLPNGYLEMALRRFSRSYKYIQHNRYAGTSELDDYWVDLVIALESITSKDEKPIKKNMARRISLLLGTNKAEQNQIKTRVEDIYKQRCSIVHGDEKNMIADVTHEKIHGSRICAPANQRNN